MSAEMVLQTSVAWFARAGQPDGALAEICAQALAMRHAATAHYREFAERMGDLGYDEVAVLFARMGESEAVDASVIEQICAREGMALANVAPHTHSWLQKRAARCRDARACVLDTDCARRDRAGS